MHWPVVHSQNTSCEDQRQQPDQFLCCCAQPEHVLWRTKTTTWSVPVLLCTARTHPIKNKDNHLISSCAVVHSQNTSYKEQRQPPDHFLCCCALPEQVQYNRLISSDRFLTMVALHLQTSVFCLCQIDNKIKPKQHCVIHINLSCDKQNENTIYTWQWV